MQNSSSYIPEFSFVICFFFFLPHGTEIFLGGGLPKQLCKVKQLPCMLKPFYCSRWCQNPFFEINKPKPSLFAFFWMMLDTLIKIKTPTSPVCFCPACRQTPSFKRSPVRESKTMVWVGVSCSRLSVFLRIYKWVFFLCGGGWRWEELEERWNSGLMLVIKCSGVYCEAVLSSLSIARQWHHWPIRHLVGESWHSDLCKHQGFFLAFSFVLFF